MGDDTQLLWLSLISILIGVGLLFVRVRSDQSRLEVFNGGWPFRFPAFRYGLAALLIGIGVACVIGMLRHS